MIKKKKRTEKCFQGHSLYVSKLDKVLMLSARLTLG